MCWSKTWRWIQKEPWSCRAEPHLRVSGASAAVTSAWFSSSSAGPGREAGLGGYRSELLGWLDLDELVKLQFLNFTKAITDMKSREQHALHKVELRGGFSCAHIFPFIKMSPTWPQRFLLWCYHPFHRNICDTETHFSGSVKKKKKKPAC